MRMEKSIAYLRGYNDGIATQMPEITLLRALLGNPTPEQIIQKFLKKAKWKSSIPLIQKVNAA